MPRTTREVDVRRAALALADLAAIPLRRVPYKPLLARCWEPPDNLTVYDASYVALAEALDITLLTGDRRLARAPGPRCRVEMLRPASLPAAGCSLGSVVNIATPVTGTGNRAGDPAIRIPVSRHASIELGYCTTEAHYRTGGYGHGRHR